MYLVCKFRVHWTIISFFYWPTKKEYANFESKKKNNN